MLNFLFPQPVLPRLCLDPFTEHEQALRDRDLQFIDAVHAGCPYRSEEIKQAIHLFKYRRLPSLCHALSRLIIESDFSVDDDAVLCPVPLHWTREFWRGFNQAELIATKVSDSRSMPMQSLLKRTRPTGHQAHRKRVERLCAVRDAFVCTVDHVPENIIVVDDLATTGATLDACAYALKSAGAKKVEGWVIAHG